MTQLSLPLPLTITAAQQTALLNALTAQNWIPPQPPGCHCDQCRRARQADAVRNGRLPPDELERLAAELWNLPGIHQPPGPYIDYDPFEELHRAVHKIRLGRG